MGIKTTQIKGPFLVGLFCSFFLGPSGLLASQDQEDNSDERQFEVIQPSDEIAQRAKRAAEKLRSEEIVDLTGTMGQRVRRALGVVESEAERETGIVEPPHKAFRAILFASQSMPLQTLRRYASQLEKVNGVMVFRGVPGGLSRLKPLVQLTSNIIKKDPNCDAADCDVYNVGVILDPLIFRNNQITKVPAVTIVDTDPFAAYCERPDQESAAARGPKVTFGDVHLTGHLEALGRMGDDRADVLLEAFYEGEGPSS